MNELLKFPENFKWGAATSSYQIEGAWNSPGKGLSIWDVFSHTKGNIEDGSDGDIACDHFNRWQDDLRLMKELGHQAYRFSISWPRLLPMGRGRVQQPGLDFYNHLVDGLLENGITPFVTLYHWDLPQFLQDEGGWAERRIVDAFVDYTEVITRSLGDRVKNWITLNEPAVITYLGHLWGGHAPGIKDHPTAVRVAHHLLVSHGCAVPVIRSNSPGAEVGITIDMPYHVPASQSPADLTACRMANGMWTSWFMDPLYGRPYPQDVLDRLIQKGSLPPDILECVQNDDMKIIATPTDFQGLNYYTRSVVRSHEIPEEENDPATVIQAPVEEWTDMGWEVYPEGLYQTLKKVSTEYPVSKIYITENGCSYSDSPGPDGSVHDQLRIDYLHLHFAAAHRAISEGVPLAGYFAWSLMDNFEWARGYTQRFGLVWVDFETQQRIVKDSALWYKGVIEKNGISNF